MIAGNQYACGGFHQKESEQEKSKSQSEFEIEYMTYAARCHSTFNAHTSSLVRPFVIKFAWKTCQMNWQQRIRNNQALSKLVTKGMKQKATEIWSWNWRRQQPVIPIQNVCAFWRCAVIVVRRLSVAILSDCRYHLVCLWAISILSLKSAQHNGAQFYRWRFRFSSVYYSVIRLETLAQPFYW